MTALEVLLPEWRLEQLKELAQHAGVSPDEFASAGLEEWLKNEDLRFRMANAIRLHPKRTPAEEIERRTIHYTELPDSLPGSPLHTEWMTYKRELSRLLAEGHEGEFILIKDETIHGLYKSDREANTVASQRFLGEPVLIHQILTEEPLIRLSSRCQPCRS